MLDEVEGSSTSDMAVIIEGISLSVALLKGNQELFLQLCQYCRAVFFCRVSPIQKTQVFFYLGNKGMENRCIYLNCWRNLQPERLILFIENGLVNPLRIMHTNPRNI